MSPVGVLGWGAAIRLLRWLPMIAGLVALDAIGGTEGPRVRAWSRPSTRPRCRVMAHRWLTERSDLPVPEPSWREALLVWANISVLLTLQVALGDPGGTAGRIAAVLCGLALGALASELVAARGQPRGPRRTAPLDHSLASAWTKVQGETQIRMRRSVAWRRHDRLHGEQPFAGCAGRR